MRERVKEWIKRYLPAEILSILVTLASSWLVFELTQNAITTALAGTWGGNIAYFGYILISDILISLKKCKRNNLNYKWKNFLQNIRALAVEFGIAELIDSLFIRPTLMYYFPIWLDNLTLGVLVAKIAADVTFYIPAIISYEFGKKYMN